MLSKNSRPYSTKRQSIIQHALSRSHAQRSKPLKLRQKEIRSLTPELIDASPLVWIDSGSIPLVGFDFNKGNHNFLLTKIYF